MMDYVSPGSTEKATLVQDRFINWNFNAFTYRSNTSKVTLDMKGCNGILAINTGDTLVYVNNIPLKPFPPGHPELTGAAVSLIGNKGEIFVGEITLRWDTPGATPEITIIQKFYNDVRY